MNECLVKKLSYKLIIVVFSLFFSTHTSAEFLNERDVRSDKDRKKETAFEADNIYVASDNSVQQVLNVIAGEMHKPVIVSSEAAKKRVTGNFDLNDPMKLLANLATRTGLIWYDDGSSIYVYDSNEMKNIVIRLSYATFDRLVAYLKSSELYDVRFPLRSDGQSGSFYVSGPPVYVELVKAAAKYIDSSYSRPGTGKVTVRVIKLNNSFVNDRNYTQRDLPLTIPGVASVLNKLLNSSRNFSALGGAKISVEDEVHDANQPVTMNRRGHFKSYINDLPGEEVVADNSESARVSSDSVNIVAYSDTNSLLVMGTERQVSFVEDLIRAIDIAKRQIQLSLWIIDISKEDINELGVQWSGSTKISSTGVIFGTSSLTPESSINFLANVSALVKSGSAQVISRPEILTQENVPALFDNNSSFYARLVGERNSSLEKITYGTMISVLPRLAERQHEIEMILDIHDGTAPRDASGDSAHIDSLPVISNTQISTEARVPLGYSLLVGGYSRNQDEYHDIGIPLLRDIPYLGKLFDYSYKSQTKMVRLFLIHPRLLDNGETWQGRQNENPVIGINSEGKDIRLRSTVSMLREVMNQK
ncbi:type III secretion system outer membrane ring subunit SctC [Erwinia amylovora]|uniref:Type 3 secretion system secretin n=4 Tax=Erwinia amylovora TaxID=552 RepID=A0A831EQF0_ERWAM|nr:type III secretion system outer membrane ring subunit SctC [Erwinia amylovora]CDK15079.1 Type III secretory protein InvG [Erwinia amylovora LA635]CDK18447.1 Type III secretory protein InvG [Erwinia amylovora LA636]CDK21816.1 Type III secretory protein InvG [Erwinia amylovora LA637]ATZ11396.1 EscC/YscC/HrcC family type III secretion system outer membrane ring protein [Erwinia amylovora]EKV54283.1 Type III secretory protein InvG [Erwinia amylovora ACW56400]